MAYFPNNKKKVIRFSEKLERDKKRNEEREREGILVR